jgi:hypothetical protein
MQTQRGFAAALQTHPKQMPVSRIATQFWRVGPLVRTFRHLLMLRLSHSSRFSTSGYRGPRRNLHATTESSPCCLRVGLTVISTSCPSAVRNSRRRSTEKDPERLRMSAET